jgi:hypothetical protein
MQNTIVKEFEGNPGVVAAVFDQGGQNGETRDWLETFWDSTLSLPDDPTAGLL